VESRAAIVGSPFHAVPATRDAGSSGEVFGATRQVSARCGVYCQQCLVRTSVSGCHRW
jgi:hypothetical protein